jgi:hypothetical protein
VQKNKQKVAAQELARKEAKVRWQAACGRHAGSCMYRMLLSAHLPVMVVSRVTGTVSAHSSPCNQLWVYQQQTCCCKQAAVT